MSKHNKFFNVIYTKPMGQFSIIAMEQYWDEQSPEAFQRAEEIAATGQPVIVKSGDRSIRTESVRWQSFTSKGDQALLDR